MECGGAGTRATLSVVVVNFNYASYLAGAIRSALDQGAHEVIVVDDGSTDDSRRVVDGFAGRVIPVFKTNGGHSSAVNAGFEESTGDYVVFLDADDALLPGAATAILAAVGPGVSKVQWGLRTVDAEGVQTGHAYPSFTDEHSPAWCREQLARCSWYDAPPTSGNAWSRAFLSEVMPLPERVGSSGWALDDYLHLLAPSFGDVVSVPGPPLGEYRIHQKQMSALENSRLDRVQWVCADEILRYELVNDKLSKLFAGASRLDPMRWSGHALNRLLLRKAEERRENLAVLTAQYVRAYGIADLPMRSKVVNALYGVALATAPRPLARWLVRKRLAAAAAVFESA